MNKHCSECGSSLPADAKFCGVCGTVCAQDDVQQPVFEQQPVNTYVTPAAPTAYVAPPELKPPVGKKKGGKLKFVIPAAVVLLGGVAAAAFFFVMPLLGSPYQRAELKFIRSLAATGGKDKEGANVDLSVGYKVGDNLSDYFGDFTDFSLKTNIKSNKEQALANFDLTLNGDTIDGVQVYTDGSVVTIGAPRLLDFYMYGDIMELSGNGSGSETPRASELDQKKLAATITNIGMEYLKVTGQAAEVEKGVELSGGDVTLTCDEYVIEFKEKMTYELLLMALKEIRANKNLVNFLDGFSGDYTDFESELLNIEDQVKEELEDVRGDGKTVFRMTVWIKGSDIVGRRFDKIMNAKDVKAEYLWLTTSKNAYVSASFAAGDVKASAKGNFANEDGWTGTLKLSYDQTDYWGDKTSFSVSPKISGFKVTDGLVDGKVTFKENIADMPINMVMNMSKDGKKQTITLSGSVDDIDLGKLTVSAEDKGDPGAIKAPTYNETYGIDIYNDLVKGNHSYDVDTLLDQLKQLQLTYPEDSLVDMLLSGLISELEYYN